jgi:hypothetical protein
MIQLEVSVSYKPGVDVGDLPDNEWVTTVEKCHEVVGSEGDPLLLVAEIR